MGRGIEGCGVTRYALEEQKWFHNNSIECDVFASIDKKWGREKSQDNAIIPFKNENIKALTKKLNAGYDIVYYQSLPAKKGHSEEYKKLFYEELVCGVHKPIKISHQNDHKAQSLSRNSMIWETMAQMDASFTHSLQSPFAKIMSEKNPDVPVMKMGLGFDFEELHKYWKPIDKQLRRASYFGRFAGFKHPMRMIELQPFLAKKNIFTELRGIERSIGSLDMFYTDVKDRDNTYRTNIIEMNKKNAGAIPSLDKAQIFGPYNRLEGIEELSSSMFGADFYNLDATAYGNNMEFAMCEIIATGVIALFDKHWADNCTHINGTPFKDLKNFAIYSDREDLQDTADQMEELANDNTKRDKFRKSAFELAKQHCDNDIVYRAMYESSISVKKRTPVTV